MYFIAKIICICLYFATALSFMVVMPHNVALTLQGITLLFLITHILEIIFFMRHLRLYPGPLLVSMVLTLLFGLLHWKPMADASKANPAT
jgi:uncharacterized membrane protein